MRVLVATLFTLFAVTAQPVLADDVSTTLENFRGAGAGDFIDDSYGYAVFPSIGKGGIGIGGAHGKGEVHVNGKRCLLYTSPSPRDGLLSRMPSSA